MDPSGDPARANGFSFDEYEPAALAATVRRAMAAFRSNRRLWGTCKPSRS